MWFAIAGAAAAAAIVLVVVAWSRRDSRRAGRAEVEVDVVREGRERERRAEVHLLDRARGLALLRRLRRRAGDDPPGPPAAA